MKKSSKISTILSCLHPSLKFTFEKEKNNCLLFHDINMEQTVTGFETSVYRKYPFFGQHLHWESFSPNKDKKNLNQLWYIRH